MSCLQTIILIGLRSRCTISYLIRCLIPQMMLRRRQIFVLKEMVGLLILAKTSNGSPFIISIKRPLFKPYYQFVPQYLGRKYVILPLNFTTIFFQCYNFGSRRSESSLTLLMATIFYIFSSWVLELFLSKELTKLMMTLARCMQQEPPQAMGLLDFSFTSAFTMLYTKSSIFFSPTLLTCREFLYFRWWQSLRCMRLSFAHCELFSLNLQQQRESIFLQSCFSTIIFSHIFLSCAFCFFNFAQPRLY